MVDPDFDILECTLRDGSYVVDFQFTARDTGLIASYLESAGFRLIEIGHGLGLNASNLHEIEEAAATDEEYMQAATNALSEAQWGMFFIPGIGRHEDLELASQYGMHFVRIGTNANEVEEAQQYIEHAKQLGMFVSANLMKSYALPPDELTNQAKRAESYGADVVALVDSAGCMLPRDVRTYVQRLTDSLSIPVGFHCHDNLSLGIANVLTAIDTGARFVDSTLQGLGRGGGNPASEILVTVLRKRGYDLGIDANRVMDMGERIVKPMLQDKGWNSLDITSGYAGFHSSYLRTILKYTEEYEIDARELIVRVCEVDQINVQEGTVERAAQQLEAEQALGSSNLYTVSLPNFTFPSDVSNQSGSLHQAVRNVARKVRSAAKKRGRHSVLNVVSSMQETGEAAVSQFIQESFDYAIGNVEIDNSDQLATVVEAADGVVDILLVDADGKPFLTQPLAVTAETIAEQSCVIRYRDGDVWVRSVNHALNAFFDDVQNRLFAIFGTDRLALKLVLSLLEQRAEVVLTGGAFDTLNSLAEAVSSFTGQRPQVVETTTQVTKGADAIVAFDRAQTIITHTIVSDLPDTAVIFDAGIGTVTPPAVKLAHDRNICIIRPDMRSTLAAELSASIGMRRTVKELMGYRKLAGIPITGGGLVGEYGTLVVDSVGQPSKVIGVADGLGRVIYDQHEEFATRIASVEQAITRDRIAG